MKLKIYYRGVVAWNIILYICLSLVFVYLQEVVTLKTSPLDRNVFVEFIKENTLIGSVYLLTIISFLLNRRGLSHLMYFLSTAVTFLVTTNNLVHDFSKFSLVILFFHLLIAYYFYQFYCVDSDESYYNPSFDETNLFDPMLVKLDVSIVGGGAIISRGHLTNWSREGCFIYLDKPSKLTGSLSLEISFLERVFRANATIITASKCARGYGVKFKRDEVKGRMNSLGWSEFYEIIEQMGFSPERLK